MLFCIQKWRIELNWNDVVPKMLLSWLFWVDGWPKEKQKKLTTNTGVHYSFYLFTFPITAFLEQESSTKVYNTLFFKNSGKIFHFMKQKFTKNYPFKRNVKSQLLSVTVFLCFSRPYKSIQSRYCSRHHLRILDDGKLQSSPSNRQVLRSFTYWSEMLCRGV